MAKHISKKIYYVTNQSAKLNFIRLNTFLKAGHALYYGFLIFEPPSIAYFFWLLFN